MSANDAKKKFLKVLYYSGNVIKKGSGIFSNSLLRA